MINKYSKAKVIAGWKESKIVASFMETIDGNSKLTILEAEHEGDNYYIPAKSIKMSRQEIFQLYSFLTQILQDDEELLSAFKEFKSKGRDK